ncbi:MAG: PQQ-binding-like beta-propeller repeat protein [Planctomycetota bacterium]
MMHWPRNACLLVLAFGLTTESQADNWPRFRGPNGDGQSSLKGIPSSWSDKDYAWKVELSSIGHSAPVIWEKTLFVTTATEGGGQRYLHCFDADSGAQRWTGSLQMTESKKHLKNSWASSTPVTDGQHVCVMFADSEKLLVAAWDFAGKQIWTRNLGPYNSEHGLGVSPIIHSGLLIIPNEQVGPSSLIALNPGTGDVVWESSRLEGKTSYSTPAIATGSGVDQIITIGESNGFAGTELKTGKLLWQTPRLPMRTVGSPLIVDGLAFGTCGEGGNGKYFAAVRIDPDPNLKDRIVYERKTTLPYVPCLLENQGLLFLWGDKGIMVCLEATTGKEVWAQRIDGQFSGSPICIDNRLFCVTEDGIVVVLSAGPEFKELGRTKLGDDCHSTPAVANGHLYIHSFRHLFALKARP